MIGPELDRIVWTLLDQAVGIWIDRGTVVSTSWAIGPQISAFAQPNTAEAARISIADRVRLHAEMALRVKARYIGRIDEAYVKLLDAMTAPDSAVHAGDLARIADTDPEVTTAILVEGHDLATTEGVVISGRLMLSPAGEPYFEPYANSAEGSVAVSPKDVCDGVLEALDAREEIPDDVGLDTIADRLNWTVIVAETLDYD